MAEMTEGRRAALREEIVRLGPWHHDVMVVDGLRTGEVARTQSSSPELGDVKVVQPDRILPLLMQEVYPGGLAGRSVLDCACNAGGFLFAAADLGAGRGFGFDVREHWIRQARFLSAHRPAQNIEFANCELADLPSLNLGRFDVTFFMGILYHLPDPLMGLRIAADHTSELLVVNTAILPHTMPGLVLNLESDTDVMSGVDRLAWLPTGASVIQQMLAWCGFPHSRVQFETPMGDRRRIQILAARDKAVLAAYDRGRSTLGARVRRSWRRWRRWYLSR